MKYRRLDTNGDYVFGQQNADFYQNIPEAVAQAIKTRLGLSQGEWFLDINEGTPYSSSILGAGKVATYDAAIQAAILNTQGVTEIVSYSSNADPVTRRATVSCTVNTQYGTISVTTNI